MTTADYYSLDFEDQKKIDKVLEEENLELEELNQYTINNYIRNSVITNFLIEGTIAVLLSNGIQYQYDQFVKSKYRTSIANDLLDNTFAEMEENDIDLCFSTYLSDSSTLCRPFQNRVYGVHKEIGEYSNIDDALWKNGGGLLHPNCRHHIDPYFPGDSLMENDPLNENEIKKNEELRNEYVYSNRNYFDWKEKERIAKEAGINNSYYKKKSQEWKNRRDAIKVPDDVQFIVKYL